MIDIETLSLRPTAQIIQLGAAFEGGDVFLADIQLDAFSRFHTDLNTLEWWQSDEHRARMLEGIKANGSAIESVLTNFNEWVKFHNPTTVWCKGAAFDFAVLRYTYSVLGIPMPWSYKIEMCYRTVAKMYDEHYYQHVVDMYPNLQSHNALEDARHQLAVLRHLEINAHMISWVQLQELNKGN